MVKLLKQCERKDLGIILSHLSGGKQAIMYCQHMEHDGTIILPMLFPWVAKETIIRKVKVLLFLLIFLTNSHKQH